MKRITFTESVLAKIKRTGAAALALAFIMTLVLAGCDMMGTEDVSSDANLSSITVSSGTLSPGFSPGTVSYTVSVGNNIENITVNASAAHPKAAVSNSAETGKALSYGSNAISITVTAEDGTKKTYTVTVTRDEGEAGDGNTPLTGQVFITGVPQVGVTLTANTASLGGSGPITYVWKRGGSHAAVDEVISGAGGVAYTPAADDQQKHLTVTVSREGFTDSITSYPTERVIEANAPKPAVNTVTVSPPTPTVVKGGTQMFTAAVTGENDPAQTVIWSVTTSGKKAGTAITKDGELTVAGDEALTSLTIKAVSVLNPEKYGEATVTVEAPPEPVLPAPKGANALSGKTYFDRDAKIYFSPTAPGAASGTYTKKAVLYTYNEDVNRPSEPVLDANGKYTWVETATGAYSWDADAKKVTLAPEKAAPSEDGYGYGPLETKSQYRVSVQEMLDQYTQEEEEELSAYLQSLGFSSIEEFLDRAVEYTFKNVTNNYALSADNKALFLDELLPANKGSNELAGNTYYDTTWDSGAGQEVRDESATYVFATDGSCAYTYHGGTPQTYSYAFDRDARKVYLKVPTTERQTAYVQSGSVYNAQYYDSQDDAKAAEVNGRYNRIDVYTYDTPDLTLRFRPF